MAAPLLLASVASAQSVTIPRLTSAPRLAEIASSASLDRPIAIPHMVAIEGLVQRSPVDGAVISESTAVYLGYDTQHVYALFVCSYPPGAVRAHRVNRDRIPDDDDSVALQLDTFRDRRRLYGFQVNPAGVQTDGVYTEGQGWNLSFDTVWTAETIIQPERYFVLITVPFSSIRFPATAEHEWGLFVYRGMPRKNEEAFWPAYSVRYQGRIAYAAQLRGLRDVEASHSTQIVPYGTFRAERLAAGGATHGAATERFLEGRGGVDVKSILHESLVLDLTANPDFSQVESDEPQTTVNKRFEVFFPEKRPFFTENGSYFETPLPVLFTRRIRDPNLGARLTGKIGRYAIGALVTDDIPAADSSTTPRESESRAVSSVFRISRDIGTESQLGLIYVGRKESAVENHVAGLDGRWRISPNWSAAAQTLASATARPRSGSQTGTASRVTINGNGRRYGYQLAFMDLSPKFQASAGFIPRADIRQITQTASATFHPAGKRVLSWGPIVTVTGVWDHDGIALDRIARFETQLELPRSSRLSVFHAINEERLRVTDAPTLSRATTFDQHTSGVSFGSAPLPGLAWSGEYSIGTAINLAPAAGEPPTLTRAHSAALTVLARPAPAFTIDTTYLRTALDSRPSGAAIFSDPIIRSRWNYQITRRLSARAIARYEELSVNHALSSLRSRREFSLDVYSLHIWFIQERPCTSAGT